MKLYQMHSETSENDMNVDDSFDLSTLECLEINNGDHNQHRQAKKKHPKKSKHGWDTQWKVPTTENDGFIRCFSPTWIKREYPLKEPHVFGKGSVGLGLYSLDTKDAYRIMHRRVQRMRTQRSRFYRMEQEEKQKAIKSLVICLQLQTTLELRLMASGPYTLLDRNVWTTRLQRMGQWYGLPKNAVKLPGQVSLDKPVYPYSLTFCRRTPAQSNGSSTSTYYYYTNRPLTPSSKNSQRRLHTKKEISNQKVVPASRDVRWRRL